MSDLQEEEAKPTLDVMRERLHHLGTIVNTESPNADEFARWADTRLDRWIVDWCLRTGKERTAKQIAHERGIEASRFFIGLNFRLTPSRLSLTLAFSATFDELKRPYQTAAALRHWRGAVRISLLSGRLR